MNKKFILYFICLISSLVIINFIYIYSNKPLEKNHIKESRKKTDKDIVYVNDYEEFKKHTAQGDDWIGAFNNAIKDLGQDGGTIVFSGNYLCSDRLLINNKKNIKLIGKSKSKITFLKYDIAPMGIDFVNSENITIKGLTLTSPLEVTGLRFSDTNKISGSVTPEQSNSSILHVENVNNFKIEDINIPFHNGFGIVVTKSKEGLIQNNNIKNTWRDGIHIQDGNEKIRINKNTLEKTGDDAISVFSSGAEGENIKLISKDINIENNLIMDSYNRGIWITGENIQVANNRINGTAVGGIYSQSEYWHGVETKLSQKIVIKDNILNDIGTINSPFNRKADMFRGILIETQNQTNTTRVQKVVIENNQILKFANSSRRNSRGIQVLRVRDCIINENTISHYSYEGITATYSENLEVTKNKIKSSMSFDDSRGIHCDNIHNLELKLNDINGGTSTGINVVNSKFIKIKQNTLFNINPKKLSNKNGIIVSNCEDVEIFKNIIDTSSQLENVLKLLEIKDPLTVRENEHI